jgi:type IX secretion system PorP/SprF family membrane protein
MKSNVYTKFALLLLLIVFSQNIKAQQQVQYTQYMYNTLLVNPAYAGTSNRLEAYFIHRSQWVGMDGAPHTQNFGVQGAVTKRLGLGLNITNDNIGPSNTVYIDASAAVRIPMNKKINLSVGMNVGMDILNIDWNKGKYKDGFDQVMFNNIKNRVRPIVGAGLYAYGEKWYFGVSSPNFIKKDSYGNGLEAQIHSEIHWYFIGGYVFDLTENLKLKPAVMGKIVKGAPFTFDLSANFLIQEKYTAGIAYRYHDALSLLLGITIKKSYFIGYSYDITLSKLRGYGGGSHDIMFKYSLLTKEQGARSPRFF